MNVYKINDIINYEFLKIPKSMFLNKDYRELSSDAKLTYALLYDRLSLSKLNNWINENCEVYLIYTREEIAEDLGLSYKKAISAFRELLSAGLIREQRCGRGMPNKIYIVKIDLSERRAKEYCEKEKKNFQNGISGNMVNKEELPKGNIKKCKNGISETSKMESLDMPKLHPNKTYINKTEIIHTDNSQSVLSRNEGLTDEDEFYKILENCQLDSFDEEERKIFYDALERLYYSNGFKIGQAILPKENVRRRMKEITASTLQSAIHNLHKNENEVKNITAYVMTTIFNCITEDYTQAHIDPFLNSIRPKGGNKAYVS